MYYTIRTIFFDRIAPPTVHIHLRLIDVASSIPVGDLTGANSVNSPLTAHANPSNEKLASTNGYASPAESTIEADPPEKERLAFDEWLRALWRLKDEKLEEYHLSGSLSEKEVASGVVQDDSRKHFNSGARAVQIPLRLRDPLEVLDAFCFFVPAALVWAWRKVGAS